MFRHFRKFNPFIRIPLIVTGGLALMAALAFLFGLIVMVLWNWIMPEIFGLSTLTYWQAWGLVILCQILFKVGPGHKGPDHIHDREWKEKFRRYFRKEEEEGDAKESPDQVY